MFKFKKKNKCKVIKFPDKMRESRLEESFLFANNILKKCVDMGLDFNILLDSKDAAELGFECENWRDYAVFTSSDKLELPVNGFKCSMGILFDPIED